MLVSRTRIVVVIAICALAGTLIATSSIRARSVSGSSAWTSAADRPRESEADLAPSLVRAGDDERRHQPDVVDQSGSDATLGMCVVDEQGAAIEASARLLVLDGRPEALSVEDLDVVAVPPGLDAAATARAQAANGRLEFTTVETGKALELVLASPGRVVKSLFLAAFVPGERRDLGRVELACGQVVRGVVSDGAGNPIPGARVVVVSSASDVLYHLAGDPAEEATVPVDDEGAAPTDERGRFRIPGLPAGTYKLAAFAPGMLPGVLGPVRVPDDTYEELTLRLGAGRSLCGRVLDENGNALTDARVALLRSASAASHDFARTRLGEEGRGVDADGRFSLGGLTSARAELLIASAPGRVAVTQVVVAGMDVEVVLALCFALEGRVVDAERVPVPEALVTLEPAGGARHDGILFERWARSGPDGSFRLEGLPQGDYALTVACGGERSAAGAAWVGPTTAPLELRLAGSLLTVHVANEAGSGLEGVLVELFSADANEEAPPRRASTDGDGLAILPGLRPGTWRVRASHGGTTLLERAESIARLPARIELVTPGLGGLVLDVVDAQGVPVARVPVQLTVVEGGGPAPLGAPVRTDDYGRACWPTLSPGSVRAHALFPTLGEVLSDSQDQPPEGGSGASTVDATVLSGRVTRVSLVLEEFLLRVRVLRSGAPVAASVSVAPESEVLDLLAALVVKGESVCNATDRLGWVRLVVPGPGDYVLLARTSAHSPATSLSVRVTESGQAFTLELSEAEVVGVVAAGRGDARVAGARVRLIPTHSEGTIQVGITPVEDVGLPGTALSLVLGETHAFTDSSGLFRFLEVPDGSYRVEVEHPEYANWTSFDFEIRGKGAMDCGTVILTPSCVVRGRVTRATGAVAELQDSGLVRIVSSEGRSAGTSFLDEEGRFQFEQLSPGRYRLVAQVDDVTRESDEFEVRPDEPCTQEVHLP